MIDLEIVGEMRICGKVVCQYNKSGEPLFLARGWELVDGELRQTSPMPSADLVMRLNS
jgi:hypothetical protein